MSAASSQRSCPEMPDEEQNPGARRPEGDKWAIMYNRVPEF